jgi:hypothetical protein
MPDLDPGDPRPFLGMPGMLRRRRQARNLRARSKNRVPAAPK